MMSFSAFPENRLNLAMRDIGGIGDIVDIVDIGGIEDIEGIRDIGGIEDIGGIREIGGIGDIGDIADGIVYRLLLTIILTQIDAYTEKKKVSVET
jgi:hypothetical protein